MQVPLLTRKLRAPSPDPPLVVSSKSCPYVAVEELDIESVAWSCLLTVTVIGKSAVALAASVAVTVS